MTKRMGVTLLALLLASVPLVSQSPAPTPGPLDGVVDVGGRSSTYHYHFNHNALADMVDADDGTFVALTGSGNLLRFSIDPLALVDRVAVSGRATAIAPGDRGTVLVGTADGQVAIVQAAGLDLRIVARVDGAVVWMSLHQGRVVVVSRPRELPQVPGEPIEMFHRRLDAPPRPWSVAVIGADGVQRRFPLTGSVDPSAFFIDRRGRLWLGANDGEFGGRVAWMDLVSGRLRQFETDYGIFGFVETARSLYAYGGLSHFVCSNSYLAALTLTRARAVQSEQVCGPASEPDQPAAPIVDVLPDGDGLLVLSGGWVYRTDRAFSNWTRVSAMPAARLSRGVSDIGRRIALLREGLGRISDTGLERSWFSDQLAPHAIEPWLTSLGFTVIGMEETLQLLQGNEWVTHRMCPDDRETPGGSTVISSATALVSDDDGVLIHCKGARTPGRDALVHLGRDGPRAVVEWQKGRGLFLGDIVPAPDGSWLALPVFEGEPMRRLAEATWLPAGSGPSSFDPDRQVGAGRRPFVELWRAGADESIVLRAAYGDVLLLTRADGEWTLQPIGIPELVHVWDAVPDDDSILLATAVSGILRFTPASRTVAHIPSPAGDRITSVARDGLGRLWAVGDRLHVSADEGQRWQEVALPMLSPTQMLPKKVRVFSPAGDAVVVGLGEGGVVIVE